MTKIEQALSEIKRRAATTDLRLYQEGVGVRAGFHKTRHVSCICIPEDEIREALKEVYGKASVLDPEPSQHTP